MPERGRRWYKELQAFAYGMLILLIHIAGLAAILGFIKLVERMLQLFWGTEDVLFFEVFKLKYLFQATDLVMLIGFLSAGTYRFLKAINNKE